MGPALLLLELGSIARGYVALDAMAKRAVVEVLHAEPITPGKYWIALHGGEAELDEALVAGLEATGGHRVDHALLPYAHPALMAAVAAGGGVRQGAPEDAVGVIELSSLSAAVRAADAALKGAAVNLVDLHLGRGIGGKGTVVFTGPLEDVEAAVAAGAEAATDAFVVATEILANPDVAVTRAAVTRRR
jgi:microcompartment protein CcmL/EutN